VEKTRLGSQDQRQTGECPFLFVEAVG
jgi:hypothetical protein